MSKKSREFDVGQRLGGYFKEKIFRRYLSFSTEISKMNSMKTTSQRNQR